MERPSRGGSYYRQRFFVQHISRGKPTYECAHYFQPIDIRQLQNESSMKIALVGATGNVGTRLISELTRRGHRVTAIARHPENLQGQASVGPVSGDVQDENALAAVLAGHDVVIHRVKFLSTDASKIIAAPKAAKVPRLLVAGGAGSLEVSPGLTLVNTTDFPAEYKPETLAGVAWGEGTRLDVLISILLFCSRRTHRQIPTRQRRTFGCC
jgi:NAD(P)-dependent dehydrogenase (short-subunit alcohol dehydrogenase family)